MITGSGRFGAGSGVGSGRHANKVRVKFAKVRPWFGAGSDGSALLGGLLFREAAAAAPHTAATGNCRFERASASEGRLP